MEPRVPEHLPFETIRSRVSLTAVLQHYGLLGAFKSRGPDLVGRCPIHGGTHARQFVVSIARNTWRCFSVKCDRHGDVVDFVAAYERIPLAEAAHRITHWFALVDPIFSATSRSTIMAETHAKPSHRVYVTEDITEGKAVKTYWTKVGAAWPHKDGKGLTITISPGISVSGRVVLREWTEEQPATD